MRDRQIRELDTRHDALVAEARELVGDGSDPLEGDALERFTEIESDIDALNQRRSSIDRITVAMRGGHAVPGTPQVISRVNESSPIRDRALDRLDRTAVPIENGDRLDGLLRDRDPSGEAAEWVVKTADVAYESAFRKIMSNPRDFQLRLTDAERVAYNGANSCRAAMSLTAGNGGFLVPFTLDPTIIQTNNGAESDIRRIARIETIATDDWNGVSSAGVTAEWLAEAAEAADASPTVAQPSITVHKAAAYLQASLEVAQDSNIADQVMTLVADAKNRLEATAFATGSGTGQPVGLVTALNLTTASRVAGSSGAAGAADLVAADIYALDNALPARHRPNGSFIAERSIWNSVRQLANVNAGNNPSNFWVDFEGATPSKLIGYPVYQSSAMDSTIVSGSNDNIIILGDFREYLIVDRVGLAVAYNPLVVSTGSGRPTGEVGWFAYWRVGADSVNDNAFRMLRV